MSAGKFGKIIKSADGAAQSILPPPYGALLLRWRKSRSGWMNFLISVTFLFRRNENVASQKWCQRVGVSSAALIYFRQLNYSGWHVWRWRNWMSFSHQISVNRWTIVESTNHTVCALFTGKWTFFALNEWKPMQNAIVETDGKLEAQIAHLVE